MDGYIATIEVYQLRIALREISPAIWRRVLVRCCLRQNPAGIYNLEESRVKADIKHLVQAS